MDANTWEGFSPRRRFFTDQEHHMHSTPLGIAAGTHTTTGAPRPGARAAQEPSQ
jgi:hypothetical protein